MITPLCGTNGNIILIDKLGSIIDVSKICTRKEFLCWFCDGYLETRQDVGGSDDDKQG